MSEKISIYIPAYNSEKTIEQSIVSVLNQSIKVDEIIVIDDNSTDHTEKILKKFSNIKIIKNNKNKGLGFNRNLGMKECKNEIVASIDSDVVLDKFWLEEILKNFNKNHVVMSGGIMTEKLTNNKYNAWRASYYSQNWGNDDLNDPPFLFGCNTIQLKKIWIELNGYNESLLTNGEDIDYCKKIKNNKTYKLYYSSNAKCYHLQNDDISSLSNRIWRYHSFGYKIKKPSFYRFLKLILKQFKFLIMRFYKNLIKLNFLFIYISFVVFVNFIYLEYKNYKKNL